MDDGGAGFEGDDYEDPDLAGESWLADAESRPDAPPPWSQELREAGLVALQAAVLTRRIFLPATRPAELSPEQWQMLLAVALVDESDHGRPAATLGSLARLLTLTPEAARDTLAALIDSCHVTAAADIAPGDASGGRRRWTTTASGRAAATGYLERARRFLPGWPPH